MNGIKFKKRQDSYVNYKFLKFILKPLSKLLKKCILIELSKNKQIKVSNLNPDIVSKINDFALLFIKVLDYQFKKVETFFELKVIDAFRNWRILKINSLIYKQLEKNSDMENERQSLYRCFNSIIKQNYMIMNFFQLNQEAIRKIVKKYKKVTNKLQDIQHYDFMEISLKQYYQKSNLGNLKSKLDLICKRIEDQYLFLFFKKQQKNGQQQIVKIQKGNLVTQYEFLYQGNIAGISISLIIFIIVLTNISQTQYFSDLEFLSISPILRMNFLIIIYYLSLSINIAAWKYLNVNYQLIFQFNHIYSELHEIFKRIGYWTILFLVTLIWNLIIHLDIDRISNKIDFVDKLQTPYIFTLIFIIHFIFPHKKYFNYNGRLYIYQLFQEIIIHPFNKLHFKHQFLLRQILSWRILLNDLEYSVCNLLSNQSPEETYFRCMEKYQYSFTQIICFIPMTMESINQINKLTNSQSKMTIFDKITMIKALLIFLVIILAQLTVFYNELFKYWIFTAVIVWVLNLIIDLKQIIIISKNMKNMCISKQSENVKRKFYLINQYLQIFLRGNWILSICPQIVVMYLSDQVQTQNILLLIASLEILRKCFSNFFCVEIEQVKNLDLQKATEQLEPPFINLNYEYDDNQQFVYEYDNLNDFKMKQFISCENQTQFLRKTHKYEDQSRDFIRQEYLINCARNNPYEQKNSFNSNMKEALSQYNYLNFDEQSIQQSVVIFLESQINNLDVKFNVYTKFDDINESVRESFKAQQKQKDQNLKISKILEKIN